MNEIREFFWPLLDKGKDKLVTPLLPEDIIVEDANMQKTLEYVVKIYDSELSRNTTIETKASLFISTLAIITSIVLAITTTLIGTNGFSGVLFCLIFILFILTVYVLRTVWFAVKVHERKPFYTFYHSDIFITGNENEYAKKLICSIVTKTKKNAITINSKIDNMVMAQEYFKRAIVTLSIYAIFLIFFFIDKCKFGIKNFGFKLIKSLNEIHFGTGVLLMLIIISVTSVIINFIMIRKLKKLD